MAVLLAMGACGQTPASPEVTQPLQTVLFNQATVATKTPPTPREAPYTGAVAIPRWRYVTIGWVEPVDAGSANDFSQLLNAFVITNQQEFEAFNSRFPQRLSRGTINSLARIEFGDSILFGVYYL